MAETLVIPPKTGGVCDDCHGRGWLVSRDGGAGAAKPCPCRATVPVEERMRRAGIGADLLHCSLDGWDASVNGPLPEALLRYAEEPAGFLTIIGGTGRGKSHAAAAIIRASLERGVYCRWCDLPLFIQDITGTGAWDRGREEEARLQTVALAAIDDLGAERETEYTREVVSRNVRARHVEQLPTIFTSNLSLRQIQEWEPRIASRLAFGTVVELQGKDYRIHGGRP